jgi:outer membrane murein-binding lipoprotein Lpp
MKRLIILLSAIMLSGTIGFATPKNDTLQSDSTNYKAIIDNLRNDVKSLKEAVDDLKKSKDIPSLNWGNILPFAIKFWDKILLFVLAAIVLALLVFIILDRKKRRDEILYTLTGRNKDGGIPRVTQWENEIVERAVNEAKQNWFNSKSYDIVIEDLQCRVTKLENDEQKTVPVPEIRQPSPPPEVSSSTLYANAIIYENFNKVNSNFNDDTVYELLLPTPNAKNTEFTIYKNAYGRVIACPDLLEGCNIQKISDNPNSLNIEKGVATLQDDGKWKITQKAKVRFV